MAATPRKITFKTVVLEASLSETRLKKLAIQIFLPPEKPSKGNLHVTFKCGIGVPQKDETKVLVHLNIDGKGLSDSKENKCEVAFTIDAAMDGLFTFSRKPEENELNGWDGG